MASETFGLGEQSRLMSRYFDQLYELVTTHFVDEFDIVGLLVKSVPVVVRVRSAGRACVLGWVALIAVFGYRCGEAGPIASLLVTIAQ